MDFFNQREGFPFNQLNQSQFSPEYLHEIKQMVQQYNSVLNNEFWGTISGLNQNRNKKAKELPIEIWECSDYLYVQIFAPGVADLDLVDIDFKNEQVVAFKMKQRLSKPAGALRLLSSELPQKNYERELYLKKPVHTTDYSLSHDNGILTYTFKKKHDDPFNIPLDF